MNHTIVVILVSFSLLVSSGKSGAEKEPPGWREGDNAKILPQYCQDRLDKHGRWTKWKSHFGTVYIHMHHYCDGIYSELMGQRTFDKRRRAWWVNRTIQAMAYVSPHCDSKCVVYADLHRRWAWALSEQGKHEEAAKHYQLMAAAQKQPKAR